MANGEDERDLREKAQKLLLELPELRPQRVAQARKRLQEGFYDRDEVLEQTADQLLREEEFLLPEKK